MSSRYAAPVLAALARLVLALAAGAAGGGVAYGIAHAMVEPERDGLIVWIALCSAAITSALVLAVQRRSRGVS